PNPHPPKPGIGQPLIPPGPEFVGPPRPYPWQEPDKPLINPQAQPAQTPKPTPNSNPINSRPIQVEPTRPTIDLVRPKSCRRSPQQEKCDEAYADDVKTCQAQYSDPLERTACYERAALRYARCLAGEEPRPPL